MDFDEHSICIYDLGDPLLRLKIHSVLRVHLRILGVLPGIRPSSPDPLRHLLESSARVLCRHLIPQIIPQYRMAHSVLAGVLSVLVILI